MDLLSLNAWNNGCRIGVWGEPLTHFLPLVMNRAHAEIADKWIKAFLQQIAQTITQKRLSSSSTSLSARSSATAFRRRGTPQKKEDDLDKCIDSDDTLKLIDILITMMNQIVVQFVMGNKNTSSSKVSMVMCEKVVLGYCALHHLLLYLTAKNKSTVIDFANQKVSDFINRKNGCNKQTCKDLGKFLIYLLISSKYSWVDVADIFIQEVFTRQVRWIVKDRKYQRYDTTEQISRRIQDTFTASEVFALFFFFFCFLAPRKSDVFCRVLCGFVGIEEIDNVSSMVYAK